VAYSKRIYGQVAQTGTDYQLDVEIHQNLYTGAASEVYLGSPAFKIRMGNSGDKYAIIKGEECEVNIAIMDGDNFSWLYTNDDRKFLVIIKLQGVLKWSGFVLVDQYQEDYAEIGFISLIANDQIGMLDVRPYSFGNPAVSPMGYQKAIKIIANCLSKTGLSLNIRVASNLFETTMNMGDTDDPFDQALYNQDRWINDDLTAESCKTVIEDILGAQCRILQSDGVWWIQRVSELADASVDYREFDALGDYVSHDVCTPQIETGDDLIVLAGGIIAYESGWKERNIEVDYGLRSSLIPSYALPDSIFITDTNISGWDNPGAIWGRMKALSGNILAATTYNREDFDPDLFVETPSVLTSIASELSLIIKTGKTNNAWLYKPFCYVKIVLVGETETTYYDDSSESWSTSAGTFISGLHFPKVGSIDELVAQSLTIKNIPANGSLSLRVYAPFRAHAAGSDDYFYFTEIKITGSFAAVIGDNYLDGQTFNVSISDNTNFIPDPAKIRFSDGLGDDALLPYYTGFIKVGNHGSRTWVKKSLVGSSTPMPLVSHSGSVWGHIPDSWGWQYYTANKKFRGSFWGALDFHNTIKFIDQGGMILILNDVEIDLCDNIIEGEFIEIKSEDPGEGSGTISLKSRSLKGGSVQSGQGLVAQPGGADGQLQFKQGGDFEGAEGYSYDSVTGRILKGGTLPLIEYRRNAVVVAPGPQTIAFMEEFLDTDVFSLDPVIWGVYTDEENVKNAISAIPYNITKTSFQIDFKVPYSVSIVYTVMINR